MFQDLKNHLISIYKSFYLREFYYDLFKSSKSYGFQYLMLLAFIVSIPVSIHVKMIAEDLVGVKDVPSVDENYLKSNAKYISNQIPKIHIENKRFVSEVSEPKEIYAKGGKLVAVIDTSDKLLEMGFYDNVIVVNSKDVIIIIGGVVVNIPAADFLASFEEYFSVSKEKGKKTFLTNKFFTDYNLLVLMPTVIITIICAGWFFVSYLFTNLLFSVAVALMCFIVLKKNNFPFRTLIKISIYTSTPIMLLEFISFATQQVFFSDTNIIYLVIHVLYIHFAVESYKKLELIKN